MLHASIFVRPHQQNSGKHITTILLVLTILLTWEALLPPLTFSWAPSPLNRNTTHHSTISIDISHWGSEMSPYKEDAALYFRYRRGHNGINPISPMNALSTTTCESILHHSWCWQWILRSHNNWRPRSHTFKFKLAVVLLLYNVGCIAKHSNKFQVPIGTHIFVQVFMVAGRWTWLRFTPFYSTPCWSISVLTDLWGDEILLSVCQTDYTNNTSLVGKLQKISLWSLEQLKSYATESLLPSSIDYHK